MQHEGARLYPLPSSLVVVLSRPSLVCEKLYKQSTNLRISQTSPDHGHKSTLSTTIPPLTFIDPQAKVAAMSKTDGDAGPSRTRSSRRSIVTASTEDRVNISSSPVKTRPIRLSDAVATNTIATNTTTASSSPKATTKGKEKEHASTPASAETPGASSSKLGKRVLPARLRRAAGGGQDGIRDLEEMIVDWLDRYGRLHTTQIANQS